VKALDRKLLRDLWRMAPQVLTVALVVGVGIASYIASITTWRSLVYSRDHYYLTSQFADVFASVQRAPDSVLDRIRAVPGVAVAEGRVVDELRVEVEGFEDVVRGIFVSFEPRSPSNRMHIYRGRLAERDDEVVISENFAKAHLLGPGSSLTALVNGRRAKLRVAGIGVSPEYVWVIPAGAFWPDDKRFGVFWMGHRALSQALKMEGNFNDLSVSLSPGASEAEVKDAVDRLLAPWGSFGAIGRDKQPSNRLVSQEMSQLRATATLLPLIFLAVAAYLLNVLLSRAIAAQREQIAALKALGYTSLRVGLHYVEFALAMVFLGALIGAGLGAFAGRGFVAMYTQYFRFPVLEYRFDLSVFGVALAISVAAALVGTVGAVRRAVRLAPAEAMRPEAPRSFRPTILERLGVDRLFPVSVRMVFRDLERQPWRTALSALGIALATAILVAGNGTFDMVDRLFMLQFERSQREDVAVSFARALQPSAVRTLGALPGVLDAEAQRSVPVRLRAGHRSREAALTVMPEGLTLRKVLDVQGRERELPESGLALSRTLAEVLGVGLGDPVEIELLEGERPRRTAPLTAMIDDYLGLTGYMREAAFLRLTGEPRLYSEALLRVDRARLDGLVREIVRYPMVVSVARREEASTQFRRQISDIFTTYQGVLAAFAAVIAVGVVYNNARIALTVRSRDLATLRILGFTGPEIANILLGEQMVQVVLGVILGLPLGRVLSGWLHQATDRELFRFPTVVSARTYAFAAAMVFATGIVSAALVRRRAKRLDLVAVLKARD